MKTRSVLGLELMTLTIALTTGTPIHEWNKWKLTFGKTYPTTSEEQEHFKIWSENFEFITEHRRTSNDLYTVELNAIADQRLPNRQSINIDGDEFERSGQLKYAPDSWDWRTEGAIGPVKNQGSLGDSQAIVAAECVNSYNYIQTGEIVTTSQWEVHDCCTQSAFGSSTIFQCINETGGLCSEASYSSSASTCRNNSCTAVAKVNGGKVVRYGDEDDMKAAVYTTPVMAVIDASQKSFQTYVSGIYSDVFCSATRLDHAIQVVGYGSDKGQDYWICKNSWGTSWGENGYIRIARNQRNMCGIASLATYPV